MIFWSISEDEKLTELHAKGIPFREMGKIIGRSHNSCISRSRMLKLPPRDNARFPLAENKTKYNTVVAGKKSRDSVALPEWIGKVGISIMELTTTSCRWPSKDKPITYCGCKVVDQKSYCPTHYRLAYQNGGNVKLLKGSSEPV